MNEPTTEHRLDLWRYAYSRSSFLEARSTARLLIQIQADFTQDHRTALFTALIVTYARPFTVARVAPKLKLTPMHDIPVPAEHKGLHDDYFMETYPLPISEKEGVFVLNLDDPTKPWIVKA